MSWINDVDPNIPIVTSWVDSPDGKLPSGWSSEYHVNIPVPPGTTPSELAAELGVTEYVPVVVTLQRVYSGDDPANPQYTLPLRFPSDGVAQAVLHPLGYWTP